MKTNNKLAELSLEELQTKQRKSRAVVTGTGIVMVIALIIITWSAFRSKNFALFSLVCTLPMTLLPGLIYLNQLGKEIKSRS